MTDPLAELEAADAARFEAMVKEGARWLEGRAGLGPLEEHPAIVYTGAGYRVWLHSVVRAILEGVSVPTLLRRLKAAEADRDALLARLGEADERLTRERAHIADLERKIKHVKQRARQAAKRKAVDVERLDAALVDALESGQRVHALLRAAEAVCRRVDETAATCVPSTERPMAELIAEWKARS